MNYRLLERFRIFTLVLLCAFQISLHAQSTGYEINGHLDNFAKDSIFLGYYYADKQYLLDTAVVTTGTFTFADTDTLAPGAYLIVMPPDNRYFQLMINKSEQSFSFTGDLDNLEASLRFDGSRDNSLFYENLRYIATKRSVMEEINLKKSASNTPEETAVVDTAIQQLNREVMRFQKKLVADHPSTLTAALIKSGFQITIPDYEGTAEEIKTQQYHFYKKHYFDNVDLSDSRLLRSPQHVLFDKVNYYIEKLTPQHPDSIIQSLDYLLHRMEGSDDIYKYYLVKFLNDYAQSKIVGMDAVYVHLALEYYGKGKAPWIEEEQLEKIIANAKDAEPTLIGKIAPNFTVQDHDSVDVVLDQIASPYLVLIFWAHDCGHCKETMPQLVDFYETFKEKGVEIMAVCTKLNADEPPCWDFIEEKKLDMWINASDKRGGRSFVHSLYDIKKTPKVFVLDAEKKIISKELGPEQLTEFFTQKIGLSDSATGN